jgi:hypothetical protein
MRLIRSIEIRSASPKPVFSFFLSLSVASLAVRIKAGLEAAVHELDFSRTSCFGAIPCGRHAGWSGTNGPMQAWEIRPQFRLRLRLDLNQTIY